MFAARAVVGILNAPAADEVADDDSKRTLDTFNGVFMYALEH